MEFDAVTIGAGVFTLALLFTTWSAHREGNERRDVIALGTTAGLGGLGTLIAAFV